MDEHFSDDNALCSLRLDALVDVNDQKHQVDDLGSSDDGSDQGSVAWAVDEGELEIFLLHFGFEFL